MMLLRLVISLIVMVIVASGGHKLLTGRTGTGKSYIANLLGCSSPNCSGKESCTKQTKICSNGIIDSVGMDDDGVYSVTNQDGSTSVLSGLSYPLYNLLESLERSHINEVTLFNVIDTNNVRRGQVETDFYDFMEKIGCRSIPILNKYRDDHKSNIRGNEIIVREGQREAPALKEASCKISLPYNWRDILVKQDPKALQTIIHKQQCSALHSRKGELLGTVNELKQRSNEEDDGNNCLYWGETGGRQCKGIHIFGRCSNWEPNRGWKTDHDCIRRRDIANNDRRTRNENKRKLIAEHEGAVSALQKSITSLNCA